MDNMGPRYSFDSDPGEQAPLDASFPHRGNEVRAHIRDTLPPGDRTLHSFEPSQPHFGVGFSTPYEDHPSTTTYPPRSPVYATHTATHPEPAFAQLRQNSDRTGNAQRELATFTAQPISPLHDEPVEPTWNHRTQPNSITPGADNFSEAAAGGIPGLAMNVAERNARESGLDAMKNAHPYQQQSSYPPQVYQRSAGQTVPYGDVQPWAQDHGYETSQGYYASDNQNPYTLGRGLASSPNITPSGPTPTRSLNSFHSDPFRDPQVAYGQRMDPRLGQFDPNEIDDDGDEGLEYRRSARNSMLSLGNSSNRGPVGTIPVAGAAGATTTGGVLGGLIGRTRNSGVNYDPVQNPATTYQGAGPGGFDQTLRPEKSDWIAKQSNSKKKWRWIIGIIGLLVIAGAVVGGVLGSMFAKKSNNSGGGSGSSKGGTRAGLAAGGGAVWQTAEQDMEENGDLDINSVDIKALLNNPDLHKVFPGVDYTPLNVQYPDCMKHPPSQNNVTRDLAILSQLTNTIRLYGTDCNQTEMTIHALQQLKMQDEIKIWLGVWQDNNETTNARQLDQMWRVLDQYGDKPFKGLIIGNEILFRKEMTAQALGNLLDTVRANLSRHDWDLPVATSDLGDNWDPDLAEISDYIMGNVHPFFAGQQADEAASWTYTFWNNKAGTFFKSEAEKNVISEIGWPSQGGTDCGGAVTCERGATAGIKELNTLMDNWVCQALEKGTNYFWFEMFDEPWKFAFNEEGKEWEDHWGLLDVDRRLKPGVKIPDCRGKTV
ncbi:glycoside hydrolase superfamily [Poronia punctata]|nr:glycoside hydrolase superfamily [Poronia punctata]